MNRRQIFFVIDLFTLTGGALLVLWLRGTNQPLLSLKIVKQGQVFAKPVVFFRLEVTDRRKMGIAGVDWVAGDTESKLNQLATNSSAFRTESEGWFPGNIASDQKDFGVFAPKYPVIWKLRVRVGMEEPSPLKRLAYMPSLWKAYKQRKNESLLAATRHAWNTHYFIWKQIESDWITNSVSKP